MHAYAHTCSIGCCWSTKGLPMSAKDPPRSRPPPPPSVCGLSVQGAGRCVQQAVCVHLTSLQQSQPGGEGGRG
jgi:hypothetical protein